MRVLRQIGSLAFVLGLFTAVFAGIPWYVLVTDDPVVPIWLRTAIFFLLGGILMMLATLAIQKETLKQLPPTSLHDETGGAIMLLNSDKVPDRSVTEVLGLVQGHTVFAIWLGKDLSAIIRLILGGELTEYTDMMGTARSMAINRMTCAAEKLGADAVINVRYMTTSVVGSAAELLVYGTAVRLTHKPSAA